MTNDLISRSALLENIAFLENGGYGGKAVEAIKRYTKRAPSVDAVEVCRCKDCKHMEVLGHGYRWCKAWDRIQTMGDEGFCCFGERGVLTMKICKYNDGIGRCSISGERCTEGPCDCEELIEYAPVQHGKWHAYENPLVKMIRCSRCGSVSSGRLAVETPYCPICGARMERSADDDSRDDA